MGWKFDWKFQWNFQWPLKVSLQSFKAPWKFDCKLSNKVAMPIDFSIASMIFVGLLCNQNFNGLWNIVWHCAIKFSNENKCVLQTVLKIMFWVGVFSKYWSCVLGLLLHSWKKSLSHLLVGSKKVATLRPNPNKTIIFDR